MSNSCLDTAKFMICDVKTNEPITARTNTDRIMMIQNIMFSETNGHESKISVSATTSKEN